MRATEYISVRWRNDAQRFVSTICYNGEVITCGSSRDPREAAKLRDLHIIKYGLPLEKLQVLKKVKK